MSKDIVKTSIATLYNILFAPDLCGRLFSIIALMNSGHTCLFNKVLSQFSSMLINRTWCHYRRACSENMHFWIKNKEKPKLQQQLPKGEVSLNSLHHRLGHRSTRSLPDVDPVNFWQNI